MVGQCMKWTWLCLSQGIAAKDLGYVHRLIEHLFLLQNSFFEQLTIVVTVVTLQLRFSGP